MIRRLIILLLIVGCVFAQGNPPFGGTIFIDPDIITSSDSTTFDDVVYLGQGIREMFDRRENDWVNYNAFLFNATYKDDLICEIQVNPEFNNADTALIEALKYGKEIGRLSKVLRKDVATVWIHKGTQPFGGGNNNLLIHTGQALDYINDGILEEVFVHEAAHTSLDSYYTYSSEWNLAQNNDNHFVSNYAQDYPSREDIAESFLPWLAVRYRSDRISDNLKHTIIETIPNRLKFFDNQSFDMSPIVALNDTSFLFEKSYLSFDYKINEPYPNPFNPTTTISFSIPEFGLTTITAYDITGRQLETLTNEVLSVGNYNIDWDASSYPSGVYLIRMDSEDFTQTQKVVLVK